MNASGRIGRRGSRFHYVLLAVVVAVVGTSSPRSVADQVRVALPAPAISAETESAREALGQAVEAWHSMLGYELARSDLFAVVERVELPRLYREWEQARTAGSTNLAAAPRWLGADVLLIPTASVADTGPRIDLRWVDVADGVVEESWQLAPGGRGELPNLADLPASLRRRALAWSEGRGATALVAVTDFVARTPFERNRWLETGLARRLRNGLRRYPGLLVLEREEMDALYREKRLLRAGLTESTPPPKPATGWVVSGHFTESQPLGEPLALVLEVRVENRETAAGRSWTRRFAFDDLSTSLLAVEAELAGACLARPTNPIPPSSRLPGDALEARRQTEMAIRLMGLAELDTLESLRPFAWQLPPHAFSESRNPFDTSPRRRATMLRAVRYLETASVLAPDDAGIQALLSSVLADRSVGDTNLALDLAEEVGALHREFRGPAWRFVAEHAEPERRRLIRDRLVEELPGSWEARLAVTEQLGEWVDANRDREDPGEAIDKAERCLDLVLGWGPCNEADVTRLFQLTQFRVSATEPDPAEPRPRPAAVRARGTRALETLARDHPQQAFPLALAWLMNCKRYREPQGTVDAWIRRASEAALRTDHDPWVIGVRIDPWRIELARRCMGRNRHREAADLLALVGNYHHVGEATFLLGQCAFALGQYAVALACFETFDDDHREASKYGTEAKVWAARARGELGLPRAADSTPEYTARSETWTWEIASYALPPGTITDLAADERGLWVGTSHPNFWRADNVGDLENDEVRLADALRFGGLAHVDLVAGKVRTFAVGPEISHPWITDLALGEGRLWVGTYGKGVDSLDTATGRWSHHGEADGLPSGFVQCLEVDAESVWVGTGRHFGGGVARWNRETGLWHAFLPGDAVGEPPPTRPVRCMRRVGDRLWCALEGAIYRYEIGANRWTRWEHPCHFGSVALCGGRVWFGADQYENPGPRHGIVHVDPLGTDWRTLRGTDGLPDLGVKCLSEAHGKLLVGSYGLMVLDPDVGRFTTVDLRTERSRWNYTVARVLAAHGRLWVARVGENRLYSVGWPTGR